MAIASMQHPETTSRAVLPKIGLEAAGLLTLMIGAWAGIVAFVGPVFGFSGDGAASWQWSLSHGILFLMPGAAACVAGLLAMVSTAASRRTLLGISGLLTVLCGAWLVVGPVAWPVLNGSQVFLTGAPAIRELAYWIGYSLGPGGLLLALGAFMLGRDHYQIRTEEAPVHP